MSDAFRVVVTVDGQVDLRAKCRWMSSYVHPRFPLNLILGPWWMRRFVAWLGIDTRKYYTQATIKMRDIKYGAESGIVV